jgi:hypothetical protein
VELYFHSPNTPSWRGAQLKKHRETLTFTKTLRFIFFFYKIFKFRLPARSILKRKVTFPQNLHFRLETFQLSVLVNSLSFAIVICLSDAQIATKRFRSQKFFCH